MTALENGDVDVQLMLGDEILGEKTLHVVVPDTIYFPKSNIDAVYGEKAELPVIALYNNKPVAITADDLGFMLSNEKAGHMEGIYFIGDEDAGIKKLVITAVLLANEEVGANVNVSLYKQGENSFDFDQATGGNREFAWYRDVSNATTENGSLYEIIDPNKDMVTSYTFAIDMTQIPIPEQLADLTTMLPGADVEGASAWTFLCQLAERVSVLTEIKAVMQLDPSVTVDYSEVQLINEYFELVDTVLDEETNTLTITLKWIDQTQAIDVETANPLCMLTGIKLTPKDDATWKTGEQLPLVHSGEVSYAIYLRANALYTFSAKEENQKIYGLKPFINPDNASEKGGYFESVYATLEDTYTLSRAVKNGWVIDEGGYAYYVDGTKLTGIQLIDGYYYNLGENGINVGKTKYTGLFEEDGVIRYSQYGEVAVGWHMINNAWHYFDEQTGNAYVGEKTMAVDGATITYLFDENGRVTEDVWYTNASGQTYRYYGPSYYYRLWKDIDGETYFFTYTGPVAKGVYPIQNNPHEPIYYYVFHQQTGELISICDGFVTHSDGRTYYYPTYGSGAMLYGLNKIGDYYYYFAASGEYMGQVLTGVITVPPYASNGILTFDKTLTFHDTLWYAIDENGEPITEIEDVTYPFFYEQGDNTYCYLAPGQLAYGLQKIGDYYYYFSTSSGAMRTGEYTVVWYASNELLTKDHTFLFDAEYGYAVDENGNPLTSLDFGEDVPVDPIDPPDEQEYPAFLEKDGKVYYYLAKDRVATGWYTIDGQWHYFDQTTGAAYVGKHTVDVDDMHIVYIFDEHGMVTADALVTDPDGQTLLYNGPDRYRNAWMTVDEVTYYFTDTGAAACGVYAVQNVGEPEYSYVFDQTTGALISICDGLVTHSDGKTYYYPTYGSDETACGLTKVGNYYYYFDENGVALTGEQMVTVLASNGKLTLPKTITFDEEKLWAIDENGQPLTHIADAQYPLFFEEEGKLYYYIAAGQKAKGFYSIDGQWHYFDQTTGAVYVGKQTVKVGSLSITYVFDERGIVTEDVLVTGTDGKTYLYHGPDCYRDAWKSIDGETYYFNYTGAMVKGLYPVQNAGEPEYYYVFDQATGALISICDGFVTHSDGKTYYYPTYGSAAVMYGLHKIGDYYYYFDSNGVARTGEQTIPAYASNGILTLPKTITFDEEKLWAIDENGEPLTNIEDVTYPLFFEQDGVTYYYRKADRVVTGWYEIDGRWHYFDKTTGAAYVGKHTLSVGSARVTFVFDEYGMVTEDAWYVDADEKTYLYYGPDCYRSTWKTVDDETYYFNYAGVLVKGLYPVQNDNEPEYYYVFDQATGALISICNGFVTHSDGTTYYYPTYGEASVDYGLKKIGDYYYYFGSSGAAHTGEQTIPAYAAGGLLETSVVLRFDPTQLYAVDEDGNPLTSLSFDSEKEPPKFDEYPAFVEVDGKTYYYLDEDTVAYGFQKIGDYFYYFSTTDGAMRTGEYTVQAYTSNGYLEEARAFFFHETYGYAMEKADGEPITAIEPLPEDVLQDGVDRVLGEPMLLVLIFVSCVGIFVVWAFVFNKRYR